MKNVRKMKRFAAFFLIIALTVSGITLPFQPVNAAVQVLPDRVLQVSFDDGTANDSSGNEVNGTVVGTPEFVPGVQGKAIHLVNSSNENADALQYVNFGESDALKFGEGSFSVAFWYRSKSNCKAEGAIIGNKNWYSGSNPGFTIGDMREGVTLNMNVSGGKRKDTGRWSSATDDTWHHIAAVVDRAETNTMKLYIDAKCMDTVGISSLSGTVDVDGIDFLLGASTNNSAGKSMGLEDAYIDELSVYKAALTDEQINVSAKPGMTYLKLSELREKVLAMEVSERFPQEAITRMLSVIDKAEEDAGKANADYDAVMASVEAEYEAFLNGAPAVMSFHLISDAHVYSTEDGETSVNFRTGLQDMREINPNASAIVTAGDNTENGTEAQVDMFYKILADYNPVDDEQTMIALGNHDVRGTSGWEDNPTEPNWYWETAYNLYMNHNKRYMPDTDGKVYYDRWINGYHFIVLNPENSAKDTAWMTDDQLTWLENKLGEGEDTAEYNPERPIFVVIHQALTGTHYRSSDYNGFGNQDVQVKEILKKYPQTVFISGHIHNGLGKAEIMDSTYGTLVDMPAFKGSENGLTDSGVGYEVYIYETELYMRARNFVTHKWLPEYDVSVKLPSLPVLYKRADELKQENNYTTESWQAMRNALAAAKSLIDQPYGSYGAENRSEINHVQSQLEESFQGLEKSQNNGNLPEEGKTYKIVLRNDSNYVLEYNGEAAEDVNVQIGLEKEEAENQEWKFIPVDGMEGYYQISPACNESVCVDVSRASYSNGSNLLLWSYGDGADNRRWRLEPTGDGYYSIRSKGDEKYCIDESADVPEDSANVRLWTYEYSDRQEWMLVEAGDPLETEEWFVDVHEGDWYYDAIADVYERKLMTGLNKTYFAPGQELLRSQFAVILYRMEGSPDVNDTNRFQDVPEGEFYSKAVSWASENGIITGYADTKCFGPDDPVTREQAATMLYRYAGYKGKNVEVSENLEAFPDGECVQEYAKEGVEWCVAHGIISGKSTGEGKVLDPQGNTGRAECAAVISRYIKFAE